MKFSDYVGDITIDPSHLRNFMNAWYRPNDTLVLVAISMDSPRRKVLSQTATVTEMLELSDQEIYNLCIDDRGERYSSYMSIFPVKEDNNVALRSRGNSDDVEAVYGVFIDFDVKKGAFDSKQEVFDFIQTLDAQPSIVVDNGRSGGIHAYWRLEGDETDSEELPYRWWCYVSSKTNKTIDRLFDTTRISRMPSGIYWPKTSEDVADTVKVLDTEGPRYTAQRLREISENAFQERKKAKARIHDSEIDRTNAAKALAADISKDLGRPSSWVGRMALANIENLVNSRFSWHEILEPHGWTFRRELRDGSNEWARPGQPARSAVTDFDDSPVMSLLSMSEETLMADLKEAEVNLTKYRVILRLFYRDNEREMLKDVRNILVNGQGELRIL